MKTRLMHPAVDRSGFGFWVACVLLVGAATWAHAEAAAETKGTLGVAARHDVANFQELSLQPNLISVAPRKTRVKPIPPASVPNIPPVTGITLPPRGPLRTRTLATSAAPPAPAMSQPLTQALSSPPPPDLIPPPPISPAPTASILGLFSDASYEEADTSGAVGPNHLMEALSTQVQIRDKIGNILSTVSIDSFWDSLGSPVVIQPRVLYDPYGQRWIFTANANQGYTNAGLLVAVSQTTDPTGNWNRFFVPVNSVHDVYADFPNTGFNKNWIVVQANTYSRSTDFSYGTDIYVFNKANLYAGGLGQYTTFSFADAAGLLQSQIPAATYDNTNEVLYLLQNWNGYDAANGYGYLRIYSISGPVGSETFNTKDASGQTGPFVISSTPWDDWPPAGKENFAPQLGTTNRIYTGDSRIQNVVFRQGTLFAAQTIYLPYGGAATGCTVQWWTVTPDTGFIVEQGRLNNINNTVFFAYPSIAVNANLDLLIGYSSFASYIYPSPDYSFSAGTDSPGTSRGDFRYAAGQASYAHIGSSGLNLWGQWSATTVDPLNDLEFWTVQELAVTPVTNQSRWGTWWARVSPPVDLGLTMTDSPDPVPVGGNLTYTLTVSNNYPSTAAGVTVTDPLPASVTFVSATTASGSCGYANGVVTCNLGILGAGGTANNGASQTITIVVLPTVTGQITNTATVSGAGADENSVDNTARAITTVQPSADLALSQSDSPDPVTVGSNLTYTLTVNNLGQYSSGGVVLTDTLPASVTFVSSAASQGSCTRSGNLVSCSFGSIPNQGVVTVTIVVTPTVPGLITNAAVVSAITPDSNLANNAATITTRADARPTISAIANQTINADTTLGPLAVTVGDLESPAGSLILTASSSNPSLVPNANIVFGGSGANRTINVTPVPYLYGNATITCTVTDTDGSTATTSFLLTVNAVNHPPTLNPIASLTINAESGVQTVNLTGITAGAPNEFQTLTVTASNSTPAVLTGLGVNYFSPATSGSLSFTTVPYASGTATITVTVNDGGTSNNLVTQSFTVTVRPVNHPPTLNALPNLTIDEDSGLQTVILSGISSGSPNENQTLTVTATNNNPALLSNPAVNYTSANTSGFLTFTTQPCATGSATLTVTVNDGGLSNNVVTQSFTVNVRPVNHPPTLDAISNVTILEDAGLQTINLTGITPGGCNENQTLAVTVSNNNATLLTGVAVNYANPATSGTLTFTTIPYAYGSATLTVTVNDGGPSNAIVNRSFTVTVRSVNHLPTLNPINDLTIDENAGVQTVNLSGITSGAPNENQTLIVSASTANSTLLAGLTVNYTSPATSGTLSFHPVQNAFGTGTITVTVNDGGLSNNLVTQTFTVTVRSVNQLPTLNSIANLTIEEDSGVQTVILSGITSGAPNENQTLSVTATNDNPALLANLAVNYSNPATIGFLTFTTVPYASGAATITVTVNDGGLSNNLVTQTFTVTVRPVNRLPTLDPIGNLTIQEDSGLATISLTGITSGAPNENQTLAVSATTTNTALLTGLTVNYSSPATSGTLRFTPATHAYGTGYVTVTVNDGGTSNNIVSRTFVVTVNFVNVPPAISSISDQTINEDTSTLPLPFQVSDVETPVGSLGVSAFSFNEDLVPNDGTGLILGGSGANRTLTVRPAVHAFGFASIRVSVTDGNGATTSTDFQLAVNFVNVKPTISTIPNQTIYENASTLPVAFTVGDYETPANGLTLAGFSSNQGLVPDANVVFGGSGANRTVTVTPLLNQYGTATISVVVMDTDGGSATNRFLLTVVGPPSLGPISDVTVDEDSGLHTVLLGGIASGAPNVFPTLIVTASTGTPGLITNLAVNYLSPMPTGAVTFATVPFAYGVGTITVTVNDGAALNNLVSQTFTVTVNPVNHPPTLNPIANVLVALNAGAQTVNLTGISSGAPNESQTLIVTAKSGNPALIPDPTVTYASPSPNGSLIFTPTPNLNGSSIITVTVNDGGASNNLTAQTFTVTVNSPPTISGIANQSVNENTPTPAIPFTIGDVETPAGSLVLTASSSNPLLVPVANIVFGGSGANRTLTLTPLASQYGRATITVRVADGLGVSTSTSFELVVQPVNIPPTISSVANQTINKNSSSPPYAFTIGDTETPAASLLVQGNSSNPNLLPNSSIVFGGSGANRTVILTPTPHLSGSATVTLTVVDGNGGTAASSFVLTVAPVNELPTISSLPAQTINADTATGPLTVAVGDTETPASSLTLTASSSNQALVPNANIVLGGNGPVRTATVTPLPTQFGTTTIILTVNDGAGGTATSSFLLTVRAVNHPPTLAPIANVTINANAGVTTVNLSGITSGAANENQTLTVGASTANPALIANLATNYTSPATSGTVNFQPVGATGVATITVTVNDGGTSNNLVKQAFTVTINPVTPVHAPVISSIPNQTTVADAPITIPFTISDPGTLPMNLTLTVTSSNPALVPTSNMFFNGYDTNRTLTIVPTAYQSGSSLITVTVSDGFASANTAFTLTVNPVNHPPTLDPLNDFAFAFNFVNQNVSMTGISSGAPNEPQTLTVSVVSANPSVAKVASPSYTSPATSGTFQLQHGNASGTAIITVTVNDGGAVNNSISRSFTAYVLNKNMIAPTITAIANRSVPENSSTGPIPFTVGDAQSPATTLTVSAKSSNTNLVPPGNLVLGGSGNSRTVNVTPASNQVGTATITVEVVNPTTFGMTQTNFVLTVLSTNNAPVVSTMANLTIAQDATTGMIPFTVYDAETPPANLSVTAASGNQVLVPNANIVVGGTGANRALALTPALHQSGTSLITLSAGDGTNTATSSFLLTVTNVNNPPSISAIADQTINQDTPSAPIPFTVSDLETPATSLTLSASSSNQSLVPDVNLLIGGSGANRALTITPAAKQSGKAIITVTVTDSGGASASTSFQLTVNFVNSPPTLAAIGNLTVNQNAGPQTVNLTGITSGTPPEGQTLFLTASSLNPGVIPNPTVTYASPAATGTLIFTPLPNTNGSATITVTVNDGQPQNNTVTQTFTVTVNDPPAISAIPVQVVNENASTAPIAFTVGDLETPAGSLTVIATSSNPTLVPNANLALGGSGANRTLTVTPAVNQSGTATITLIAADAGGATTTNNFPLVVNAVNLPPTLNPIGNMTVNEGASPQFVNLSGITSGAVSENQYLYMTATTANPELITNLTINYTSPAASGTLSFTPMRYAYGTATITVTVNDGGLANNLISRTFTVTINPVNNPPTLDPIADLTIAVNAGQQTVNLTGISPGPLNEATQTVTLTATSDHPSVVPNPAITYTSPNGTGTLQFTPATMGSAVITVTAKDNGGTANGGQDTFIRSFTVTVGQPAATPTLTIDLSGDHRSIIVSWPGQISGYALECSSGVGGAPYWLVVTNAPTLQAGRKTVTLSSSGGQQFFRLSNKPRLAVAIDGFDAVISWPAEFTGYGLERSTNLAPGTWNPVTDSSSLVGTQNTVRVHRIAAIEFYRLRK